MQPSILTQLSRLPFLCMRRGAGATLSTRCMSSTSQPSSTDYTYLPPGCSIKEPSYGTGHSLGSPSYFFYDPAPSTASPSTPNKPRVQSLHTNAQPTRPSPPPSKAAESKDVPEQYTYLPPGSSLKEASYGISMKDPVYFVDPAPSTAKPAAPPAAPTPAPQPKQKASSEAGKEELQEQKRHPYRMADDYAQVPYVTSPKGSMREPRYISISDP